LEGEHFHRTILKNYMHIAIDAAPAGEELKSGIPFYTLNLLAALARLDADNRYTVYGTRLESNDLGIKARNFKIERLPSFTARKLHWYSWTLWYYTFFPLQILREKPHVFLSMYPSLPLFCPCPQIAVIYDLTPLILPGSFNWRFGIIFGKQLKHTINNAQRIITISHSTENDINKLLGVKKERISVVYPGYDNSRFKTTDDTRRIADTLGKYGINGNYILYVGTLEPKKNIARLVEAFTRVRKYAAFAHKLVIAGKRAWGDEAIFRAVKEAGIENEVIFTGYVVEDELPLLMNGADAFVFPSLHEGFGIPPLEAMACGTPVVVSNVSSLPEVVGDAAITVDPYSIDAIADAVYRVISNEDLRAQMRAKGLERARLFSWEKAARQTREVLENVA
jgi:glycosyltransferase involved in cell wall biosynthesis